MFEPTCSRRDAASTIFDLPDYRVIDTVDLPDGDRQVLVESTAPQGCPACEVVSTRAHSRSQQVVADVPVGGPVRVAWAERRWFCTEPACSWVTFAESAVQVPAPERGRRPGSRKPWWRLLGLRRRSCQ